MSSGEMSPRDVGRQDDPAGAGAGAGAGTGAGTGEGAVAGAGAGAEPGRQQPAGPGTELDRGELVDEIVRYAADKKAGDLVTLDMRGVVGYTDWLVVCSGNTDRQTKAVHDGILEGCKRDHGLLPRRVEGASRGDWILMDYLDVVVHIFTPATREYYRLEQLWGEAPARTARARSVG